MSSLPPLASELNRMIGYLAGAGAGLSLLSVSTSSLPTSMIQSLMEQTARPTDILGHLIDGSIGCLTIRPCSDDGEAELEENFRQRLQPVMSALSERRFGGRVTLWLRSVHRPAADISHAANLINCLFDAASTPLTINAASEAMTLSRATLFPRVTPLLTPFIEPVERQPTLLRMIFRGEQPPVYD